MRNSVWNFVWKNSIAFAPGSAAFTGVISAYAVGTRFYAEGVDFSALGSGSPIFGVAMTNTILKNCKLPINFPIFVTGTNGYTYDVDISDATGSTYNQAHMTCQGYHIQNTAIVLTGGASDGVTPISWAITPVAALWTNPFISISIPKWNLTTGSAVLCYIRGIANAAVLPNNDQLWMEVEYLGSSSSPLGSFTNNTKAIGFATGTGLTPDSSAWDSGLAVRQNSHAYSVGNTMTLNDGTGKVWFCTVAGTSASSQPGAYTGAVDGQSVTDGGATFRAGCRFVMSISVTPQLIGYIYVRLKAAGSSTYWVNPSIQVS